MALTYSRITNIVVSNKIDSSDETDSNVYLTLEYTTDGIDEIKSIVFKTTIDFVENLEILKNKVRYTMNNFQKSKTTPKLSIVMLINSIYSVLYVVLLYVYISTAGGESLGASIASLILLPHLGVILIGSIFSCVATFVKKGGLALTSAILFTIGLAMMPIYFMFLLPMVIMGYWGWINIKNK